MVDSHRAGAHTPGPWTAYIMHDNRHQITAPGKTIAHVYTTKGHEAEDEANALLLAQGPTLLALLQEGVEGFSRVLVATSDQERVYEWVDRCRAALKLPEREK